jgi:uncharacterized oligopeptide transporter (OPT) family protein
MSAMGIVHAIGSDKFPAPQGTLMATLIKGLLSFNLDWQFVLVGAFLAVTVELCGVSALSFAVGAYLPLSTTLPIFVGGAIKGISDKIAKRKGENVDESELGSGSLFATGLVAGGALAGVIVALLSVNDDVFNFFKSISTEGFLTRVFGESGYDIIGVFFFALMGLILFKISRKPQAKIE